MAENPTSGPRLSVLDPAVDSTAPWAGGSGTDPRYGDIDNQADLHAGQIYQAGGHQYIRQDQHIQQLYRQREGFFAQVAASRTRARWLMWLGAFVSVSAIVVCVIAFASLPMGLAEMSSASPDVPAGMRIFFVGIAVGIVGQIVLICGIVLHVVATARKRRIQNNAQYRLLPAFGPG